MSTVTIPAWLKNTTDETAENFPGWLKDIRKQQWAAFLQKGLPTPKDERWKYADLAFLAGKNFAPAAPIDVKKMHHVIHQHRLQAGESILLVMINGFFSSDLSDLKKLPAGVIACSLSEALKNDTALCETHWLKQIDTDKYPFASVNTALFSEGLFLYVPSDTVFSMPIHFLSLVVDEAENISHPYQLIIVDENSQLTIFEEHFSLVEKPYLKNSLTTISLAKNANLTLQKLQQEGKQGIHIAETFLQQKCDSQVDITQFSFGGTFARDEIIVNLTEQGANCRTAGFYHLHDRQLLDHHLDINHQAPHSNSEMLYKGILERKSRAIFNGRLYVEKGAQKINAYQANHNLLLSKEAEVYSKPELEIYADDVKCKHGATTGQLDQDALFFLRARGIPKTEAIAILLEGFADEIIKRIEHLGIKKRIEEYV